MLYGNPDDIELTDEMLDCYKEVFGHYFCKLGLDGELASITNLNSVNGKSLKYTED